MPLDVGRVTHLTDQMHRSEDDTGDPIDAGFLLGADGARGHTWYDPAGIVGATTLDDLSDVTITSPVAGQRLMYTGVVWVNDAGHDRPLMDGAGAVITDAGTGEAIVAYGP